MASKPKKPKVRDLKGEMASTLPLLGQLADMQSKSYIDSQKELYDYQIGRLSTDYPMMQGLVRDATAKERQASIDFLGNSGLAAREALLKSNPDLADRLTQIGQLAEATGRTPEITRSLDAQAINDLELGGALSAEDTRDAEQAARSAGAARGMALGKTTALAEILNRNSARTARRDSARAFAASREAGNRQFTQSATQIASAVDPASMILGMPTGAAQGMGNMMGFVQGVRTPDPSSVMSLGMTYSNDLYNTNFNAKESRYNAALNRYYASRYGGSSAGGGSNMMGLGIGALGGAASGALSGAAIGSVVPGIGTAVGAVAGGLAGGLGGLSAGM